MNVEQAMDTLKKEGYKTTGKREQLVKIFANEKRYLTAKEALIKLQQMYPRVSFDTVYRNVSLFVDMNILEETELDGERWYRFRCATSKHHHHVICVECGKTKQIEACPMDMLTSQTNGEFQIIDHKFEIYGLCYVCQP